MLINYHKLQCEKLQLRSHLSQRKDLKPAGETQECEYVSAFPFSAKVFTASTFTLETYTHLLNYHLSSANTIITAYQWLHTWIRESSWEDIYGFYWNVHSFTGMYKLNCIYLDLKKKNWSLKHPAATGAGTLDCRYTWQVLPWWQFLPVVSQNQISLRSFLENIPCKFDENPPIVLGLWNTQKLYVCCNFLDGAVVTKFFFSKENHIYIDIVVRNNVKFLTIYQQLEYKP